MAQTKRLSTVQLAGSKPASGARGKRGFFSFENPLVWLAPATLILLAYRIVPLIYNIVISVQEWSAP